MTSAVVAARRRVQRWLDGHTTILSNAGSLLGSTFITSGLGFVFWWAAARLFSNAAVGLAAAAISTMMLLGAMGMLGLGTLLIGELPRRDRDAGSLVVTSLVVAGLASTALGILFALLVPTLSPELASFVSGVGRTALIALGVAFTAVTLVLDQALIGLLRGSLQLWRNGIFSAGKLALLVVLGLVWYDTLGVTIYGAWLLGNLLSLIVLMAMMRAQGTRLLHPIRWSLVREFRNHALVHHVLNLALQAPSLLMPVLVVTVLSPSSSAYYYVASMLASLVVIIPNHLATVLYAVGSGSPSSLSYQLRFSLTTSFASTGALAAVVWLASPVALSLFGHDYVAPASWPLRLLAIGAVPTVVKVHFITVGRIRGRIGRTALAAVAGAVLEVGFATVGVLKGDLVGLVLGLLAALLVEALVFAPTLVATLRDRSERYRNVPAGP